MKRGHCMWLDIWLIDQTSAGLSLEGANGDAQPEANGNSDSEAHEDSAQDEMPETVPHAQAPAETPNLLDQPR